MLWTNFDQICKRTLLEKGWPLHYYFETLLHATACIRELTFDTLHIVNTLELPINADFSVDLPEDFTDDVMLAIGVGDTMQPIPKRDSISPLRTIDASGNYIAPVTGNVDGGSLFFGLNTNWLFFWNINDYGEPTGRYFGADGGAKKNGYQVFKERRQIQLTSTFTSQTVVLIYISDGQRTDNASQIDVLAFSCVQAYILWKRSPNAENLLSPEARYFQNEMRKLRARLDGTTVTDIRQIILKSYQASIKN